MKTKVKKYYVVSASEYETKDQAMEAIIAWFGCDDLREGTKVYEITEKVKVYEPQLELKECIS